MFTKRKQIPNRLHRVIANDAIDDVANLKQGHIYLTEEAAPKLWVIDEDGTKCELAMRVTDWEGHEFIGRPEYLTTNGVCTVVNCNVIPSGSVVSFRWFLPDGKVITGDSLTFADHNVGDEEECYIQAQDQFGNLSNMTRVSPLSTMSNGSGNEDLKNRPAIMEEVYDNFDDGRGLVRLFKPLDSLGVDPLNTVVSAISPGIVFNMVADYTTEAIYSYTVGPEPNTGTPNPNPQLNVYYISNDGVPTNVLHDIPTVTGIVNNGDPLIVNLNNGYLTANEKVAFFYAVSVHSTYNPSPLVVHPIGAATVALVSINGSSSIWTYSVNNDSSGHPHTNVSLVSSWLDPITGDNESYTYHIPRGVGGVTPGNLYDNGDGSGTLTPPGLGGVGGTGDTIEGGVGISITGFPTNRPPSHTLPVLGMTFDSGTFQLTLPTDYRGVPYTYTILSNELIFCSYHSDLAGAVHTMQYHTVDSDGMGDPATIEITFSNGSTFDLQMTLVDNPDPSYARSDVDGNGNPIPFPIADLGDSITVNTQASDAPTDGSIAKFVLTSYDASILSVASGADRFNPGGSLTLTVLNDAMNLGKVTRFYISSEEFNGNQSPPVEYIVTLKGDSIPSNIALSVTNVTEAITNINVGVGDMTDYLFMITKIENGIRNITNAKEWIPANTSNNITCMATDGNAPVKVTVRVSRDGKILNGAKTIEWQVPRSDMSYDYSHNITSNLSAVYSNWGDTLSMTTSTMEVYDPHAAISGREWYERWSYDTDRIFVANSDVWWEQYDGAGDLSLSPTLPVNTPRDIWRIPAITNLNDDEWWWDNGNDLIVAWDDFEFYLGRESVKILVCNDIDCTNIVHESPELKNGQYKQYTITGAIIDQALGHGWIKLQYKWNTAQGRVVTMRTHAIEFRWMGTGASDVATYDYEDTTRKLTLGLDVENQTGVSYGIVSNPVISNLGIRISLPEIMIQIDRDGFKTDYPIWDQNIKFYDQASEISFNPKPLRVNGLGPVKINMFHDMSLYPNHHFRYRILGVLKNGVVSIDLSYDRNPQTWLDANEVTTITPINLTTDTYTLHILYSIGGRRMTFVKDIEFAEFTSVNQPVHDISNSTYNVPRNTSVWLVKAVGGSDADGNGEDTIITGLTPSPIVAKAASGSKLGEYVVKEITIHDSMSFHVVTGTSTTGGWASIQKIS